MQDLRGTKLTLPLLLFHQQPCEKYTTVFHVVIDSAFGLVVDILTIYEFTVINETMG
jgi:hypothetical protein